MAQSDEPERLLHYPSEWESEWLTTGFVQQWLDEAPNLFSGDRGLILKGTDDPPTLYNFADYALMYLLREQEGLESLTYFELGHNAERSSTEERRKHLHGLMQKWMGDDFERLRRAIIAAGFDRFGGEPDLFCWRPEDGSWLFAEAKGKTDRLHDKQFKWYEVCRKTLPSVDIRVYRLEPAP